MDIAFDAINILIIFASIGSLIYGWLVYSRHHGSYSNILFFLLTISVALWGFFMVLYRSTDDIAATIVFARLLYAAAAAIPILFFLFASVFPAERRKLSALVRFGAPSVLVIMLAVALLPDALIRDVLLRAPDEPFIVFNHGMHLAYALFIVSFFLLGYVQLIRTYLREQRIIRTQVIYIFLGTLVPTSLSLITNLLLPIYGIFDWNWFGQISTVIMSSLITYGIFKHRIFNVRIIVTEVLIFFVWLTAFLRIVFAETTAAVIFNTIAFSILVIIGYWLVRSVTREVETREKLEELTVKLRSTNARLRELDRQKSEFLSIATHQLRGPLAAIRGHLSLILEGNYGAVSDKTHEVVSQMYRTSGLMAQTITDFLNVSRIEQGRMQYEKTVFDCRELTAEIVDELAASATAKGLSLTLQEHKDARPAYVYADYPKIRHIVFNLVDNAIKYTPEGWVHISVMRTDARRTVRIIVADTGIGISAQELPGLFEKFVRARKASGININGTGLGLYVAREMVRAHDGRIWAESEGEGKGSRFVVELPLTTKEPDA